MANDQYGLMSGPGEQDVRRLIEAESIARSGHMVRNPRNAGMFHMMGSAGREIGEALGTSERDPRLDTAIKLEMLKKKVNTDATNMKIDQAENPEEYSKIVFARAMEMGMPEVAVEAMNYGKQMEYKRRGMEVKEKMADAAKERADNTGTPKGAPKNPGVFEQNNIKKLLKGMPEFDQLEDEDKNAMGTSIAGRVNDYRKANPTATYEDAVSESMEFYNDRLMPAKKKSLMGFDSLWPDSPGYFAKKPEDVIKAVEEKRLLPEQAYPIIRKHWPKWQPPGKKEEPKKKGK